MKKRLRQCGRFCVSMQCGMLLMALLAVACVLGSLVEQGHTLDWYLARYSERSAALIYGLQLDDVFHSTWFLILAVLLCVRLFATPWTAAYQAPPSMGFPGKSTGVGCHCLLRFRIWIWEEILACKTKSRLSKKENILFHITRRLERGPS